MEGLANYADFFPNLRLDDKSERADYEVTIKPSHTFSGTGVRCGSACAASFSDVNIEVKQKRGSEVRRDSKTLSIAYQTIEGLDDAPKASSSSSKRTEEDEIQVYQHQNPQDMTFSVNNLHPSAVPLLGAYIATTVKSMLSTAVANFPAPLKVAIENIPIKTSGAAGGAVAEVESELQSHVGLLSLSSAVMFIGSIRGLNSMKTAKEGNFMGMAATAIGLLSVLASPGFGAHHMRFLVPFLAASGLGYNVAQSVNMEDMPQLVAGFHSFVGLAAVLVGFANHFAEAPSVILLKLLEEYIGVGIGALTFTGSVVAAGKLHGVIPGRPMATEYRWHINGLGLLSTAVLAVLYCNPTSAGLHTAILAANTAIWSVLGVNMVMPVGGADMPVVVSLLNSFSGIATAASGFMLGNDLLTITGALVASSGMLLSDMMCRGINRSLTQVMIGGFGVDGGTMAATTSVQGDYREISHAGLAETLVDARRILIIPGYGLAVARCQQKLAETVQTLRDMKKTVHFAIHPVAGRLPGHMNVLLAEANVPYDIVREMDEVNDVITTYDVAIVIGANDIVNPATVSDVSSPIYGMPAIEVWKCKSCVVMKRSMATGYSGVDNPLFFLENVQMLFGDAKASVDTVSNFIHEKRDSMGASFREPDSEEEIQEFVNQSSPVDTKFPDSNKTLGVIKETDGRSEKRVAITPAVVAKVRKLGFDIVMETGAGGASNFSDGAYTEKGGVTIVPNGSEVFRKANVIVKVTEPTPDELARLRKGQIFIGIWGMFKKEDILDQAVANKQMPTVFNMALIPRISRAQALDVLTSMANIAGYRAVLDAFSAFPKFAKPSTTASGNTPPARVFIIGAGVAGLSAIATAHALGAKVFATDVRSAAKEQVESMGADFVEVKGMIQGEGAGGYAKEMDKSFQQRQAEVYAKMCHECDIVVCTALIPNRPAPICVTEAMVNSMKAGSVIVDLAAQNGGNCELTRPDETITTMNSVTIIGKTNYPSEMAPQASDFLARNFVNFLDVLCNSDSSHTLDKLNMEDQIIRDSVIAFEGTLMYPPPKREVEQPPPTARTERSEAAASAVQTAPPGMLVNLLDWMNDNKEELVMFLGMGVLLALGLGTNIPQEEITHLGYFVLSLLIGHFTVASVTPALHTPLISVTNAISGIIVIGGMLQLGGPFLSAKVSCALLAVFFSSVNIVGGFAVTARMLDMFKTDAPRDRSSSR